MYSTKLIKNNTRKNIISNATTQIGKVKSTRLSGAALRWRVKQKQLNANFWHNTPRTQISPFKKSMKNTLLIVP